MATIKRLSQFLNSSALRSEKHHQVVKHIGGFVHHATVGAIGGLYHRLDSLLSHFLRHSVNATIEERSGITAFRHLLITLLDKILQM